MNNLRQAKHLVWTLFILFAVSVSCTKEDAAQPTKTPEQVVRSFIELSAAAKGMPDKKQIEDLCVGEMKRAFERMTDEVFRLSYLSNNMVIKNIEFVHVEKNDTEKTATIHYRVKVENKAGTDPTLEESEREVDLAEVGGKWYLQNIRPKGKDTIAFTRGMIF